MPELPEVETIKRGLVPCIEGHPYIAHAGGGILGYTYTNSYEALLSNYQLGHRLFEFDLGGGKVRASVMSAMASVTQKEPRTR